MSYDSRPDTWEHIHTVQTLLSLVVRRLVDRMLTHDQSKLYDPERATFDEVTQKLKSLTYGTDDYNQSLKDMGPALDHHYANNKHHPEHHVFGIDGMTLVDLLEMLVDWKAATLRHDDGDILTSLEHNKKRFSIGDQLHRILSNTLVELGLDKAGGPEMPRTQKDEPCGPSPS